MRGPCLRLLAFLLLLIPSAQFAWQNRDMPQFANLHDDGLFFVSAKSLAGGHGYRIASLPEAPPQTKFPPLFPLWLSLIWRANSHFPANLALATLFSWLPLVLCLALAWRWYQELYRNEVYHDHSRENGEITAWVLTALLGLSPFMILFGSSMFSEVPFTCLVLAALLLSRKEGTLAMTGAGLLAGCAYLCRTAGIALVIAIPFVLIQKKDWRRALVFFTAALPAVIGWTIWAAAHRLPTSDPTLLYYLDYVRYQFLNVGADNFALVLWKNADSLLYSIGALVLPRVLDGPPIKMLTEALGVAMIAGVVRMVRRGMAVEYALFAGISLAILLVWHFPPTERFVLPLFPLFLAGLHAEIVHLWGMLKIGMRHKDRSQRLVGGAFGLAVGAVLAAALGLQIFMAFFFMTKSADIQRAKLADRKLAYQWIATQLPSDSTLLSYDDPLLYLYANRQGNYLPLLTRWWYAEDHRKIVDAYRDVVPYCRSRGLSYFYFTTDDLSRETGDDDRKAVETLVRKNPQLVPVYSAGIGTVYRILPNVNTTAVNRQNHADTARVARRDK